MVAINLITWMLILLSLKSEGWGFFATQFWCWVLPVQLLSQGVVEMPSCLMMGIFWCCSIYRRILIIPSYIHYNNRLTFWVLLIKQISYLLNRMLKPIISNILLWKTLTNSIPSPCFHHFWKQELRMSSWFHLWVMSNDWQPPPGMLSTTLHHCLLLQASPQNTSFPQHFADKCMWKF